MSDLSEHARRNRAHWDASADAFQERHGPFIGGSEPCWGIWQIPESELQILGETTELEWARRWPSECTWKARKQ